MRAVTSALVFVVAAVILFAASYFLGVGGIALWMHQWAGGPTYEQHFTFAEFTNASLGYFYPIAACSALAAGIGGFIFALSFLADRLNEVLLGMRRSITFVYLLGYIFPVSYLVLSVVAVKLTIMITQYEVKGTVDPNNPPPPGDAAKMAQEFLSELPTHIAYAVWGSLVVAFILALWLCCVLAFTDMLPWCSGIAARISRQGRMEPKSARRAL